MNFITFKFQCNNSLFQTLIGNNYIYYFKKIEFKLKILLNYKLNTELKKKNNKKSKRNNTL